MQRWGRAGGLSRACLMFKDNRMRTTLTALSVSFRLLGGIGLLFFGSGPLLAQSTESLANQLERLQRDVQVLSRQVFKNSDASPSTLAGPIQFSS